MTAKAPRRRKPLDPGLNVRGPVPYMGIPVRGTLRDWGRAQALFGEVFDWLDRERIAPAGPPFQRFLTLAGDSVLSEVEVAVPVAEPHVGDGRVVPGALPPGAYATAFHAGHPDRLDAAHEELRAWLRKQNLEVAMRQIDGREVWEARVESFFTDPAKEADPERWSIEIAYLLDPADRSLEAPQ